MQKSSLVLLTGGNRGIGYALIDKLLNHPKKPIIVFTSRDFSAGQTVLKGFESQYPNEKGRLIHSQLDINSSSSLNQFRNWVNNNFQTFDVLVNNAAINNRKDVDDDNFRLQADEINSIIETNYFSTINLTEMMLPLLSQDGKIVMVSSNFGQLSHQGEAIKNFLQDPKLTKEILAKELEDFSEKARKNEHTQFGYSKQIYKVTKAFLNTYTRWVLPEFLKNNQTCFACHPGWCQTRMGGTEAPSTAEEGTYSLMKAIDFDLELSKKLNGKYFNEKGEIDEF